MKILAAVLAVGLLALAALVLRPSRPPEPAVRFDAPVSAAPHPARTPAARAVVYVAGRVARPGLYTLGPGARVADAIAAAGGLGRDADPVAVNLAERIEDGEEIVVRALGEPEPRAVRGHPKSSRRSARHAKRGHRKRRAPPPEQVDLNRASADALARLPGMTLDVAQHIVAVRRLDGSFLTLDDLEDVAGMSPGRIERIAPYVVVR